jgi:hypothetical protein
VSHPYKRVFCGFSASLVVIIFLPPPVVLEAGMVVSRRSVVLRVWGIVERAGLLGGCARDSPTGACRSET